MSKGLSSDKFSVELKTVNKINKMNTISHPIICIGCHNLIVERNQQDNGCRYCCEFDETGEFHDKCRLNTDGEASDRFDEGFIMKNGK